MKTATHLYTNRKDAQKSVLSLTFDLLLCFCDCTYGAAVFACAAVNALICVHNKFAVAFCDCTNGAGICACAARNALITDNSWHSFLSFSNGLTNHSTVAEFCTVKFLLFAFCALHRAAQRCINIAHEQSITVCNARWSCPYFIDTDRSSNLKCVCAALCTSCAHAKLSFPHGKSTYRNRCRTPFYTDSVQTS